MAATFQEFARGRLLINVVSGDAKMLGAYGMMLPHDERYDMADEYLHLWHRLFAGESVTYQGKYFSTDGAKLALPVGESIAPPPLPGSEALPTGRWMSRQNMSIPIFPGAKRRSRSRARSRR